MLTRREFIKRALIETFKLSLMGCPLWLSFEDAGNAAVDKGETRFAVISDMHVATREVKDTWKIYSRSCEIFSLYIKAIKVMESIDFVLIPGDLTHDSEPWNHEVVKEMLDSMSIPYFVVPGNHDVLKSWMPSSYWGIDKFVSIYRGKKGGYDSDLPYYVREVAKGVVLFGLNSSDTPDGRLRGSWGGYIDKRQLAWLDGKLKENAGKTVLIMIHHNIFPHTRDELPGGEWSNYRIANSLELFDVLKAHQPCVVFTGHHHINRVCCKERVFEIVNPATCSYPCDIRVCKIQGKKLVVKSVNYLPCRIIEQARQAVFKVRKCIPSYPNDIQAFLNLCMGRDCDRDFAINIF